MMITSRASRTRCIRGLEGKRSSRNPIKQGKKEMKERKQVGEGEGWWGVLGIGKMGEGVFIQCMYRLLVGGNVALSLCMYHLLFASLCECVRLGSFITFLFL